MKNKKAFTLIELIAVLVILEILSLIIVPIVLNIVSKTKNSANKRSVDAYGKSIEIAISSYLLETGDFPNSLDDLKIEYNGEIVCEKKQLNKDSSIYLSKCMIDGEYVKDNTEDGYYHYGKKEVTDEDYIDMYGKALEKAVNNYKYIYRKLPTDLNNLEISYNGPKVVCAQRSLNYDGTVYMTNCSVNDLVVSDSSNKDGYYHYKEKDEVTYNGIDYYVIKHSNEQSDTVTLLKKDPLTVAEVNKYGGVGTENNHVNKNTSESKGTAYDNNGYGEMAYYSSETCGYTSASGYKTFVETGCMTDYAKSDVKHVVDAWAKDNIKIDDIRKDKTGYSARLITYDELTDNFGYERSNESTVPLSSNGKTPNWVYNSNRYWTMSTVEDSASSVWEVASVGIIHYQGNVYSIDAVRPVITILKSALQ